MTTTIERTTAETTAPAAGTTRERAARYVLAGTRMALGWIFLWAFLDNPGCGDNLRRGRHLRVTPASVCHACLRV
ncbi:hypothetical protein ACLQ24_22305 [Micromonospora sp. DT4]|uniref:hypothetical protein n=1 Tax=Micromonospora sp. DT4 TaxID=3393438 RepID=UPI003CF3DE83